MSEGLVTAAYIVAAIIVYFKFSRFIKTRDC